MSSSASLPRQLLSPQLQFHQIHLEIPQVVGKKKIIKLKKKKKRNSTSHRNTLGLLTIPYPYLAFCFSFILSVKRLFLEMGFVQPMLWIDTFP